jgi:N-succinyldiaminopimelate aminotransferase
MEFPERFSNLSDYAFPRLRALLDHHPAAGDVVHMTIGEPKHAFPAWVSDILSDAMGGLNSYPANDGTLELRNAIADWVKRRFAVGIDADTQVLALNGTREVCIMQQWHCCPNIKTDKRPSF